MRAAIAAATRRPRPFDVWVTHHTVLSTLFSGSFAEAEGLLLAADDAGTPGIVARLPVP